MSDDDEVFETAMAGLFGEEEEDPHVAQDQALFEDAMAALTDVPDTPSEPSVAPSGADPTVGAPEVLRRRVKRGELRHERELDLHGMTQEQARRALAATLNRASGEGARTVRVICGRGLHSRPGAALLRDTVPTWLKTDFAHQVETAFRAPPEEGGEGAWYAILRR